MFWLVVLVFVGAGMAGTYVDCPGCIDRTRDNSRCEWTGDTTFPLDLRNPIHQQHLAGDAQLAEELAVRYADVEHGCRSGFEGHGGLLEGGGIRSGCMARLVAIIERNHAVTAEQIQAARAERNRTFDLAVALLFAPLYLFAGSMMCRGLFRRFSPDGRNVQIAAVVLTSAAASFLALQFFQLWLAVWEIVRVGNGHMSVFRAASYNVWNQQYPGALFVGGIVGFWLVAVTGWYSARTRHT